MTHLRPFAGGVIAVVATVLLCQPVASQNAVLESFDPSDVYFQAWLTVRDAEKQKKEGKFLDAFNTYDKAKKLFDSVALHHPDWKADLVKDRQESTAASMEGIRDKALEEQRVINERVGELADTPGLPKQPKDLVIPRLTPEQMKQVSNLQRQIIQYRTQLQQARTDRDANAARWRQALKELEAQRDKLARAPMTGQLRDLETRINQVRRERDAHAAALRQSRAENQKVLAEVATAKTDLALAKKRAEELQKHIDVQQNASVKIVAGLRKQLEEVTAKLTERDKQYNAAVARAELLERQLAESRAEISDLQEERNALLKERDQMTALLKLNESERVGILIEQNMKLNKELKSALDRVQELHADNNSTKEELIEARRDLALTKARANELRRENELQKSRLASLEKRLQKAGEELEMNLASPVTDARTREEMEMLRDIIARQLRIQERRRQARDALMAEVHRLDLKDKSLIGAIDLMGGQELKLTADESKLIENYKVDEVLIFDNPPSREERLGANQRLQQSIAHMGNAARRAFTNQRYLAAREIFESILDEHPGHVETILNLGVVHMKNEEPQLAIQSFNDALVIRNNTLPFAHFMLGACYYRLNDFPQARVYLTRAIDQDPSHVRALIFLGSICGTERKLEEAEKHFKDALRLDPTLSEPYYNLAVLYSQKGDKDEALRYYREALKNGGKPDLDLEQRIGTS